MKKLKLLEDATAEVKILERDTFAEKTTKLIGKPVLIKPLFGCTRQHDIDVKLNAIVSTYAYEHKPEVVVAVSGRMNGWQFDISTKDFYRFDSGESVKSGGHEIALIG